MDLVTSLVQADDSVLCVIDVQDHFLNKLPDEERAQLVSRIGWLIEVAKKLNIPILATAEDTQRWGGISSTLVTRLPTGTPVWDKMIFGLAGDPEILHALRRTGRKTTVLTGLETDVCVSQSAIGLLAEGYSVAVVADACASPQNGHSAGLQRMQNAGVTLFAVKSLYYEWIRTVKKNSEMMADLKDIGLPNGIVF